MNWLVFHIVSGHSFFTGIAAFLIAGFLSMVSSRLMARFTGLAFVLGLILVLVSSTAIPYVIYVVGGLISVTWVVCQVSNRFALTSTITFMLVWSVAALLETPFHFTPKIQKAQTNKIAVIGDSVTAGVGGNSETETWPNIIARQHGLEVLDISHVGETAGSALERLQKHKLDASIVIIEIGGNDLLGSTPTEKFESDLDQLLAAVSHPNRQSIMFELPLPPFRYEFGRIQRKLSRKYGVKLIPKRVFLSVIAGTESTLDTIHLSQAGQNKMAETVWQIIKNGFNR